MGKSNAQRQREYRSRHLQEGDKERLQMVVSLDAKLGLKRLARHNGLTQAAMLEQLVLKEQQRATAAMDVEQYRTYVGE